jgi:hypothetical protein
MSEPDRMLRHPADALTIVISAVIVTSARPPESCRHKCPNRPRQVALDAEAIGKLRRAGAPDANACFHLISVISDIIP